MMNDQIDQSIDRIDRSMLIEKRLDPTLNTILMMMMPTNKKNVISFHNNHSSNTVVVMINQSITKHWLSIFEISLHFDFDDKFIKPINQNHYH